MKYFVPKVDIDSENFDKELEFELIAINGSSAYRNDRDRPYNGQPWTDNGIRGATKVEGLTMRDIRDCLVLAFLQSSLQPELRTKIEDGTWRWEDVYRIANDIDFQAVGQNMSCNIEKMMGIYPNTKGCPTADEILRDLELE